MHAQYSHRKSQLLHVDILSGVETVRLEHVSQVLVVADSGLLQNSSAAYQDGVSRLEVAVTK